MPKGIDPKAYAARVTKAKKAVAQMDPKVKAKIKEMYPKVTKESVVNKALSPKKPAAPKAAAVKKAAPKPKVEKRAPMETTRIGGIISVPKRPKKTVY